MIFSFCSSEVNLVSKGRGSAMTERISKAFGTVNMMSIIIGGFDATASGQEHHNNNARSIDLTRRSGVGLEWAFPGVVVGIVVPLSVSVGDALELLVSDVVVGVSVWSWSVDTFLTGDGHGWLVNEHGGGRGYYGSDDEGFHF